MDTGTKGQGNRCYVNISAIASKIGTKVCEALKGFHAYTGCDYTSSFIRKGKKRPLKIAEDSQVYLGALSALAMGEVDKPTYKNLEEYTAKIYGAKKEIPLNKHRFLCFEKSFGPKKGKGLFTSLKGVDASSIPPCENVIRQKIHHSNFVAMTWHAACNNEIPKEPIKGWELVDSGYQIVWFTGSQMPDSVLPDSANPTDNDSDAETPEPCFDSDIDESESDVDVCSETDDDSDWE